MYFVDIESLGALWGYAILTHDYIMSKATLKIKLEPKLGGGVKDFLFSTLPGEMIQFDEHIIQMGWFNHKLLKY